jgi:hypothetical protein
MSANHNVFRESAPDFTTENAETDRNHGNPGRVRFALRPPTCHHPTLASLGLAMPSRDGAPPAKPAGSPREEGRVRTRIRNPFPPASVASVLSVVKLRIAHLAGESREKGS